MKFDRAAANLARLNCISLVRKGVLLLGRKTYSVRDKWSTETQQHGAYDFIEAYLQPVFFLGSDKMMTIEMIKELVLKEH